MADAASVIADESVPLYQKHIKIYPRSVAGRFSAWRWVFVWLTQLVFYGTPWLQWGERQAVLFNLEARRFYLFGFVLYPQDFVFLTALLVICAYSLFLFTAVAGRLWCGYACPQTVYSQIFMWFERKIEGDRAARMRLDAQAFDLEKLVKKSFKQIVWITFALLTGFTFVGYFTPVRELGMAFLQTRMGGWEQFWVLFYGFATYGNAGYMREQVCKYMCPYARFQSAMFDKDTLIVTYDTARGEPRGSRPRHADYKSTGLGDCVDCNLCVHVCPTGIDIRKGLQYECIGCGACADACDTIMSKMHYAPGLIRYTTQNALSQGWNRAQLWRRVARPRVLVYFSILMLIAAAFVVSLAMRKPFRADVVRDRGVMARVVELGAIENVYRIQIMNATESPQQYRVTATGLPQLRVLGEDSLSLGPAEARWLPIRIQVPAESLPAPGSHPIQFLINQGEVQIAERSMFLVPR
jgi:cytochrome c oxidase accessory protein FixG